MRKIIFNYSFYYLSLDNRRRFLSFWRDFVISIKLPNGFPKELQTLLSLVECALEESELELFASDVGISL